MTTMGRGPAQWLRRGERLAMLTAALALVAVACGNRPDPLDIGIKRVALDLAFKDAEKAPPEQPPQVIRQIIYDDSEIFTEEELAPERPPRPRVIPPRKQEEITCDEADPNATPAEPAFHIVRDDPVPGSWPRLNTGTVEIVLGTQGGKLPMPRQTRWRLPTVETSQESSYVRNEDAAGLPSTARNNTTAFPKRTVFTLHRQVSRTTAITDTFMYENGGEYLLLVKRIIKQGNNVSEFNPTPPIRYIPINSVEGSEVVGFGGIDRENNIAMVVSSKVLDRQWVDVCGEVVDTYRVQIREQYADLSTTPPVLSGNNLEDPEGYNYWFVQYHNKLLIAREQVKTTIRTSIQLAGAPVPLTLNFDYTSTVAKVEPDPPDFEDD